MIEEEIKKAIIEALKYNVPKDEIYPSEIGKCYRQLWFFRNETLFIKPNNDIMDYGVTLHERIEKYFQQVLNCQTEVSSEMKIADLKLSGRIDILCDNTVIELKTTIKQLTRPLYQHMLQVASYSILLPQILEFYIVYINRQTGEIAPFKFTKNDLELYRRKVIEFIEQFAEEIKKNDYKQVMKIEGDFCNSCPFVQKCKFEGGLRKFLSLTK